MIDAAICDGDWVVVRQQPTAENGDIVAAMLDNEATVKTFKRKDGKVWLMPHNADFSPIDGDHATILGKVTAVLRRSDGVRAHRAAQHLPRLLHELLIPRRQGLVDEPLRKVWLPLCRSGIHAGTHCCGTRHGLTHLRRLDVPRRPEHGLERSQDDGRSLVARQVLQITEEVECVVVLEGS
jgi:hypothetical protein